MLFLSKVLRFQHNIFQLDGLMTDFFEINVYYAIIDTAFQQMILRLNSNDDLPKARWNLRNIHNIHFLFVGHSLISLAKRSIYYDDLTDSFKMQAIRTILKFQMIQNPAEIRNNIV